MSDYAAPSPGSGRPGARGAAGPEQQLERVVERLREVAGEFPQAMAWVEVEVEALRGEVRQALKDISARSAAERDELARQVAAVQQSVAGLAEVLHALRADVAVLTGSEPAPTGRARPGRDEPAGAPGRMGLGLPPRRPRS